MRTKILVRLGAFIALSAVTLAYTVRREPATSFVAPAPVIAVPTGAAERLAGSIRIPTISAEDPAAFDGAAFQALHNYVHAAFPRVHSELHREIVADHSLLYRWQGGDASLNPILLMGHLDVVPVEPGTKQKWQQDPFSGRIVDGVIWGRGALDNKLAVVGTLEAVEMLLAEGFRPARTVISRTDMTRRSAGRTAHARSPRFFKHRGVQLEMVRDEGGVIGDGLLPGISGPVALVGIAEKGFVSIELSTRAPGGHSSLPPRQSAVGIVSAAVARLEETPMPARLEGPTRQMFDRIRHRFPLFQRAAFGNLWLTRRLVMRTLENGPATNAMVRTTTAVTIFQGGTKDNVLPGSARAVINFRILPGDSIASVVEHVKRVIDDDRVEIKIAGRFSAEPSAVSATDSESFRMLDRTIRSIERDVIVAPYLVVVVTDARHYSGLTQNTFRFLPLRLTAADLGRMHGIDERIGVREYETAVRTYRQFVMDAAGSR